MKAFDDDLLTRIARGESIEQDEYDQIRQDMPAGDLARALAMRHSHTNEVQTLVEAARLFEHAGMIYQALEVCSRAPRLYGLRQVTQRVLPQVQQEYPGIRLVGKLLEEAFLVIDLETGNFVRFPPLFPARMTAEDEVK